MKVIKHYFLLSILLVVNSTVVAQSTGDYRSNPTSGNNWATVANWQRFNGTSWVAAATAPTGTDGAIEIQAGHTIILAAGVTADQITVNGTLTVNSGITLTAGPTTALLTVNSGGVVNNSGAIGNSSSVSSFNAGSSYRHLHTGTGAEAAAVPTATWASTSTVSILGFSGNTNYTLSSTSWSQAFGNVIFNCPLGNNRYVDFAARLTTVNGSFTVSGTGTGKLILASNQVYAFTIGGDFAISAGTIVLKQSTAGSTTVNFRGNFTYSGGLIDVENANVLATLNFNGSGVQIYSRTAVNGFAPGVPASRAINMTIASGSTLDMGTSSFNGNGTVTVDGTLRTGNTAGINGSLTNTGTKTFSANSTIVYNGSSAQVMGGLYPGSPASGLNVVINNTAGVTTSSLTTPVATTITTIPGNLSLLQGNLTVGAGHTLQLNGTVSSSGGGVVMNAAGNLTINGSGALGADPFPFAGAQTMTNFTLNRGSSTVNLAQNITINGEIALANGTLGIGSTELTLNGNINITSGLLAGTSSSVLTISGAGTTSIINFQSGANTLCTLNINRASSIIQFGGNFTLTCSLNIVTGTLSAGSLTITMQGTLWSVDGGSGGIFNPGTGQVIFDGATNVVYPGSFNTIQLNASRSLTFPAGIIDVSGDLTFNPSASFINSQGTLNFIGSAAQQVSAGGANFYNVTVNKTGGGVSLNSLFNLEATLDVISATTVSSDGYLTLLSTNDNPDTSASIGPLLGGADVSGAVIVQRFISSSGSRHFRYISSPVSGVSASAWQDDFAVTGNFTGASSSSPLLGTTFCGFTINSGSASLFHYNEAVTGLKSRGYVAYTGGGLVTGRGYSVRINESCATDVLIDVAGPVNKGTIVLNVTYSNSGLPNDDGWNLVGNPYPSAIRWDADGNGWSIGSDVSTVVQIRDNPSGNFVPVIEGDVIAQGQAFWVKATGSSSTLSIDETAKASAPTGGAFYRMSTPKRDLVKLKLSDGSITDIAYYRIRNGALNEFDRHDFIKQENDKFELYMQAAGKALAVNSVADFSCSDVIQLRVKDLTVGTYTLVADREGLFLGMELSLRDNFIGETVSLSESGYQFHVTSDVASSATNRFELLIAQPLSSSIQIDAGSGVLCDDSFYSIGVGLPQAGTSYFLERNGEIISDTIKSNGNAFQFMLASDVLNDGINPIRINAYNYCHGVETLSEFIIEKKTTVQASAESKIICNEGTVNLTAQDNGGTAAAYRWYEMAEGGAPFHEGIAYTTPVLSETKTYFLAAVNSLGCEGTRTAVTAEVVKLPAVEISVVSRNKLSSSSSTGNQWYLNDELLVGATAQTIMATKSGAYRVEVANKGCVSTAVKEHTLIRASDSNPIAIYPNPVKNNEVLSIEVLADELASVQLVNQLGAEVGTVPMIKASPGVWVNEPAWSNSPLKGIFYIRVVSDKSIKTIKVIGY